MLGQLEYARGGWGGTRRGALYGLDVLQARTDPEGQWQELRLRRAGRAMHRLGVVQTLAPRDFDGWAALEEWGLRPVETAPLLRAQGARLALELLRRQALVPERVTVALRGRRADRDMERTAGLLCSRVRHLVVAAPDGGEELAAHLRRYYGIPVLPPEEGARVALCFSPGCGVQEEFSLELYGAAPRLEGLALYAPRLNGDDRRDIPLLTALWESGRISGRDLKIT